MDQEKYTEEVLEKYNMTECKAVKTPISTSVKLSKEMCPKDDVEREEMSKIPYRSLIGFLTYLATSTRLDIAHAVSALGQYNSDYGLEHWKAAKRVFRYLQGQSKISQNTLNWYSRRQTNSGRIRRR
ncbi:putative retrotransposon [Lasius niger]|uniref:Putative retrotransposon n=1 Tax=Lasius niger TaxID=67767 RepID=A0A0J7K1M6_LASNI|nr:putative retrotransposon [Lasius niger]